MSKAIRNIIYELTYNPILEYWELIKYKPIFQKVESLKKELEVNTRNLQKNKCKKMCKMMIKKMLKTCKIIKKRCKKRVKKN